MCSKAMALTGGSRDFWRDDEIVVDRDGIPHYTGAAPQLMREYRRRVLFAYSNLEGSGDDEEKERKSLAKKKKKRFRRKLLDALHGEAFRACQDLLLGDRERFRSPTVTSLSLPSSSRSRRPGLSRRRRPSTSTSINASGRRASLSTATFGRGSKTGVICKTSPRA